MSHFIWTRTQEILEVEYLPWLLQRLLLLCRDRSSCGCFLQPEACRAAGGGQLGSKSLCLRGVGVVAGCRSDILLAGRAEVQKFPEVPLLH